MYILLYKFRNLRNISLYNYLIIQCTDMRLCIVRGIYTTWCIVTFITEDTRAYNILNL